MFDKLLREIRKLEGVRTISVTLQEDDDGFLDRRCPAENCFSEFKVLSEHWREKVPDDRASCPFCGHHESPQEFNTHDQLEHIKKVAYAEVNQALHRGLRATAQDFNRRQPRSSFVSMQMQVRASSPTKPLPPAAGELMRTEFTCPDCACRYRVVGSAYFCPACGTCSADQTFAQTLTRVRRSVGVLNELAATLDRDEISLLRMQLLEGGLSDLVTAFQHLAEVIFPRLSVSTGVKLRRNVFQNLTEGTAVWHAAGGRPFADTLSDIELADAERGFQQRHLLEHRDGFVDQSYIDRTGDTTYALGARLVIRDATIERLADLVEKLANALRADVAGSSPASSAPVR